MVGLGTPHILTKRTPAGGGYKGQGFSHGNPAQTLPTATLAKAAAAALIDALAAAINTQTFIDHTVQDLDEEETEMEVTHTSSSFSLGPSGPYCLTTSPTTLPALPTGLALSGRTSPFGHILLGHPEARTLMQEAASHSDLDIVGGDNHTAPTDSLTLISPSRDARGAIRRTQSP
jgi:hypothetical protein